MTIEETKDLEEMTIEQLQGSLQAYEKKHKKHEFTEQLLKLQLKDMHESQRNDRNQRGQGRGRGHGRGGSRECRALNNKIEEKANYVEEKTDGKETLLLARKETDGGQANSWYLDSGASNHMCGKKDMFMELDESVSGNVSFGDDSTIAVKEREYKNNFIAKLPMSKNRMFLINIQNDVAKCLKACYKNASWLWHLRFGHLNFGGLELLSKKKMVKGLPRINHPGQLCEGCLVGKQFRKSFPKESETRAKKPLELIHTDVCGPIKPSSLEVKVFEVFKKFKVAVERESGRKIKAIRSDRERKNRTIFDMARSMLKSKKIPKEFWAEAVACAVYLTNRSPTRSVWGKTLQEAWSGRKPSISHLRTFGSIAHVHVPDERRTKLDDKSESFIFIGYDANSKGYKLYNPNNKKFVISRDVFEEDEQTMREQLDESQQELATPPTSPTSTTQGDSSPSSSSSGSQTFKKRYKKRNGEMRWMKKSRPSRRMTHGNLPHFPRDISDKCQMGVFAPVARLETIKLIISLATQNKWKIQQMDVKSAFLNGVLEEEVYIQQPSGYEVKGHEDKVLKLKKALYGLKQAPRAWNSRIDKYFQENDFNKCPYKHALYIKIKDEDILIVCLYAYYLGIEVKQQNDGIFISQESYAKEILKKFKMENFGLVSRYMESPATTHFKAAKRILRYLKGTIDFGLFYSVSNDYKLVGYSDSDWGGDIDNRRSTTGFVFFMGDVAFTWMSKKQLIVTLSTCEAEYVAATSCVCHAIWLRNLLKEIGLIQEEPTKVCVDNKSAIALSKNPVFHDRSKHIDIRYHYIRECVARNDVEVEYVKSQDQVADSFTKPLKSEDLIRLRNLLGVTRSSLRGVLDHKLDPLWEPKPKPKLN
ncbi:hypothetical protein F3Y22_tig00110637pilonHSYRG00668 [Hibiscus syriacus]|uniref:Integrase catalytic domain-containing protein n=1 Tax=Hibiscus syriacus TaxID=106335 RepID=A0A6A2ZY77_HIBSY|nr:hypothetical protein F3Y22_tig00110637pilonHSYRG00668 [Hibiscus syriacus]